MKLFIYYVKSYSKYNTKKFKKNTHTHTNIKLKIKNDSIDATYVRIQFSSDVDNAILATNSG